MSLVVDNGARQYENQQSDCTNGQVDRLMDRKKEDAPGGIHISEPDSYYGNIGSDHCYVNTGSLYDLIDDDRLEDDGRAENLYDDAISTKPLLVSTEPSAKPIILVKPTIPAKPKLQSVSGENLPWVKPSDIDDIYDDAVHLHMSEITYDNEELVSSCGLHPNPMLTVDATMVDISGVSGDPVVDYCTKKDEGLDHPSLAPIGRPVVEETYTGDDHHYDVPFEHPTVDTYGKATSRIECENSNNGITDSFDRLQSLPRDFDLFPGSSRRHSEQEMDHYNRVKLSKTKSLTLRRQSSNGSTSPTERTFTDGTNRGMSASKTPAVNDDGEAEATEHNDENVYEPMGRESGSDSDVSWSSSEFESYEDSETFARQQVWYEGPPASQVLQRKVQFAEPIPGNDPHYPSLLRKLRESFRGSQSPLHGSDEESPCLPVIVCEIKHPKPALPPLPTGLTDNQIKRRHAIGVLVDSENSYIASLQRLIDDYKDPLMIPLLQRSKVRVEMNKASDILQYHKMFQIGLSERVKLWHTQEKIGDVFTASFSKSMVLDAYSEYVNNFSVAMDEIKKVTRQRSTLRDFLKMKEMSSSDRLGLFGLMVKPVQRFPQFITCLQDLIKYTPHDHHDRLGLQRALTELENIAHKLNERKRESEQKLDAKEVLAHFKDHLIQKTGQEQNRKLIRTDDLDQVIESSNKYKKRRLIMLNDILICVTVLSRDREEPDKYKLKWCFPIKDVEIKESSISPGLKNTIRGDPGKMTIVYARPENQEEDPFHLGTDLSDLHHDYNILSQVVGLVSTLKRSYQGITEELVHTVIRDLQRVIHVKDEQLRLVKSSTITLSVPSRTVTGSVGKAHYVFHTQSPSARQDWCLDLQIAKLALDGQNNPGWDVPNKSSAHVDLMPALFIKALPVDVVRHYTKVKCAVPVFLSTPSNIGVGMQHMWVCNTTESRGQVSIVSIHANKPRVIESYQACDCQITCVENVPGYSAVDSPYAFPYDSVWMVTVRKEVLVYQLTSSDGITKRQPAATFTLSGHCTCIKYIDDRFYAGLNDGNLAVYSRADNGVWDVSKPVLLYLGDRPVQCILALEDNIMVTSGNRVYFIDPESPAVQRSHQLTSDSKAVIGHVTRAGVGLWVAYERESFIHLYHLETLNQLQEVNVASAIQKALTGQISADTVSALSTDVEVSCLLASKGLLWMGTSRGIVLTLPLPRLREGVPQIWGRPNVSYHGQCGPIRFLLPIFCLTPAGGTLARKAAREYDTVNFGQKKAEVENSGIDPTEQPLPSNDKKGPTPLNISEMEIVGKSDSEENDKLQSLSAVTFRPKSHFSVRKGHLLMKGVAADSKRWKSTSNLTDMEGTEDINLLYSSLMRGLDSGSVKAFPRRSRRKPSSRESKDLHTSYDSAVLKKGKKKHRRSNLESDYDLATAILVEDCNVNGKEGESPVVTCSPSSVSAYSSCSGASNVPAGSVGTVAITPEHKGTSSSSITHSHEPLTVLSQESPPSSSFFFSPRKPDLPRENTLKRQPMNTCKSVIVVCGGDGYCNFAAPVDSPSQRSEEATLLLWLHKVSS